ncbi:MAG: bL17 family ribosomal protein [Candidatus Peribacteraceae bacterium]
MRHRNHSKRLARKPHQARSLLKNLVTSVILYEKVRTTQKRAQVAKALVDRVITVGKRERTDLAIRKMNRILTDRNACRKVLEVLKKRYASRSSGFTRLVPVGMRKGDGAKLVDFILMDAVMPMVGKAKKAS